MDTSNYSRCREGENKRAQSQDGNQDWGARAERNFARKRRKQGRGAQVWIRGARCPSMVLRAPQRDTLQGVLRFGPLVLAWLCCLIKWIKGCSVQLGTISELPGLFSFFCKDKQSKICSLYHYNRVNPTGWPTQFSNSDNHYQQDPETAKDYCLNRSWLFFFFFWAYSIMDNRFNF